MTTGKSFDIDYSTLQMFTGIYGWFMGKSECGDFKFMGIACIPAIPVIFEANTEGPLLTRIFETLEKQRCKQKTV